MILICKWIISNGLCLAGLLGTDKGKKTNGRQSQWKPLLKAPKGLKLKPNTSLIRQNSVTSNSYLCLPEKNEIHIQHNSPSLAPKDLHFLLLPFLQSEKMVHLLTKVICTILLFAYTCQASGEMWIFLLLSKYAQLLECVPTGKICELRCTSVTKGSLQVQNE